jgi:hypothetical protein
MGLVVSATSQRGHAGASPDTSAERICLCSSAEYCAVSVIAHAKDDLAELPGPGEPLVGGARLV